MIIASIIRFYESYEKLFGKSSEELVGLDDPVFTLDRCISSAMRILKGQGGRRRNSPLVEVKGVYLMVDGYDAPFNNYIDPHGKGDWGASLIKCFRATIKDFTSYELGIKKLFIAGVSPLSLTNVTTHEWFRKVPQEHQQLLAGLVRCQEGVLGQKDLRSDIETLQPTISNLSSKLGRQDRNLAMIIEGAVCRATRLN